MVTDEKQFMALREFQRLLAANGICLSDEKCIGALPEFIDMQKHINRVQEIRSSAPEPSHTFLVPELSD